MIWLISGLALWTLAHLFKRLAPAARQAMTDRMGEGSKGPVALALLAAVVLMVIGYRTAELVPVYQPFAGAGHLNNLLMVIAFLLFGVGSKGSWLASRMRHPMLTGMKTWAVAHLLVNGDQASIVLFGGLLVWAVVEVIVINRSEGAWTRPPRTAPSVRDARLVVAWVVIFAAVAGVHIWLGHNPFLGTYG